MERVSAWKRLVGRGKELWGCWGCRRRSSRAGYHGVATRRNGIGAWLRCARRWRRVEGAGAGGQGSRLPMAADARHVPRGAAPGTAGMQGPTHTAPNRGLSPERPAPSIRRDRQHPHAKTSTIHTLRPALSKCQDWQRPHAETSTVHTPRPAPSTPPDQHRSYAETSTIHAPRLAPSIHEDQYHLHPKTSTVHTPRLAPSIH